VSRRLTRVSSATWRGPDRRPQRSRPEHCLRSFFRQRCEFYAARLMSSTWRSQLISAEKTAHSICGQSRTSVNGLIPARPTLRRPRKRLPSGATTRWPVDSC
jgi:hypothetical protein